MSTKLWPSVDKCLTCGSVRLTYCELTDGVPGEVSVTCNDCLIERLWHPIASPISGWLFRRLKDEKGKIDD